MDIGYRGGEGLVEFMAVGVCGSDSYILEERAESLQQNCLCYNPEGPAIYFLQLANHLLKTLNLPEPSYQL